MKQIADNVWMDKHGNQTVSVAAATSYASAGSITPILGQPPVPDDIDPSKLAMDLLEIVETLNDLWPVLQNLPWSRQIQRGIAWT